MFANVHFLAILMLLSFSSSSFFSPKDEIKKEEQGVCRKVAASLKTNHLQ
jgi:hypothetical protein